MSILKKTKDRFKKLTHTAAIELGMTKIPWGSPNGRYKNGNLKWPKEQMCYEYFYEDQGYGYYIGIIYYFPPKFNGYVVPFQGNWKNPRHPAGHFYIYIDNDVEDWFEIMPANTTYSVDTAKDVLMKRIKKLNRRH
jgi:hypothetical protein